MPASAAPPAPEPSPERALYASDAAHAIASAIFSIGQNLRCPVCLSLFATPICLPCGHFFCAGCLEKTLAAKPQCPMCKASFGRRNISRSSEVRMQESITDTLASLRLQNAFTPFSLQ